MVLINGVKYACATCIKGHRSSNCHHAARPLFEIKKKGRPITQCPTCREKRKTQQVHIKCTCNEKSKDEAPRTLSVKYPNGLRDVMAQNVTDSVTQPIKHKVESLLNPCTCMMGGKCVCCMPANGSSVTVGGCCGSGLNTLGNVRHPGNQAVDLRRAYSMRESCAPILTNSFVQSSTGIIPFQSGMPQAQSSLTKQSQWLPPHLHQGSQSTGFSRIDKHFVCPPYPPHVPLIYAPNRVSNSVTTEPVTTPDANDSSSSRVDTSAFSFSDADLDSKFINPELQNCINSSKPSYHLSKTRLNPLMNYDQTQERNPAVYSTDLGESPVPTVPSTSVNPRVDMAKPTTALDGNQSLDDLVKMIYQHIDSGSQGLHQQPAFGSSAQAFVESTACSCGEGCQCPDCVEHGNTDLPIFPHSNDQCIMSDLQNKLENKTASEQDYLSLQQQKSSLEPLATHMQRSLSEGLNVRSTTSHVNIEETREVLSSSCCSGRCGCSSSVSGCACGSRCLGCQCQPVPDREISGSWISKPSNEEISTILPPSNVDEDFAKDPPNTTSATADESAVTSPVPSYFLSHGTSLHSEMGDLRCGCGCGRPFQQCEQCWSEITGHKQTESDEKEVMPGPPSSSSTILSQESQQPEYEK